MTAAGSAGGRGGLQGRTLPGGPATRAHFARLLGIEAAPIIGRTRVVAVAWAGDHVEIEVAGPGSQSVVFYVDRFQADKPHLYATPRLVLYYRGGGLWPEVEERLRAVGLGRFGDQSVEDLAARIAADQDVDPVRDRAPKTSNDDQDTYDRQSLLSTWASTDMWYQFFGVAEIWRQRLDSLDIFDRCTFIQHCDRECIQVSPRTLVPMLDGVFYPWLERVRRIGRPRLVPPPGAAPAPPGSPGSESRHSMCTTDLTEADVVLGSTDKLTRVLDHVLARGVDHMLFLSCTCVPFMTGEDVESIVKRYRARVDRPFFYLTTTPASSEGVFRDVLVRGRQEAEARTPERDPHAVNLVGFARDPGLDELTGALTRLGVRVNAVFIPEMNFSIVERLPRAPLHVLYPNALWQSLYDQLLFDSSTRSVSPPAPYGVRGTHAWLAAVAEAAGVPADPGAEIEALLAPVRAEWDALRAEAATQRLGIVVGAEESYRLCDPAVTWGVPLVGLLEEMGFGIDVMIGVADRASAREAATRVLALFGEPARHRILAFRDLERLDKLLAEGTFAACYSDHMFDRRLTTAGKAQFTLQEFEKGVGGVVRSLRRLLTICRLPLYRRYARFLKAPTQPYAAPIQGAGRRRTVNPLAGPGAAGEGLGR